MYYTREIRGNERGGGDQFGGKFAGVRRPMRLEGGKNRNVFFLRGAGRRAHRDDKKKAMLLPEENVAGYLGLHAGRGKGEKKKKERVFSSPFF